MGYNRINLGCGEDYRDDWLNVDSDKSVQADIYWDLERTPWPFKTGVFDRVLMDNVFEHVSPDSRLSVIDELYRIIKEDGVVMMFLPVPEIGIGWDLTHPSIPHWRWPYHSRHRDQWDIDEIQASTVGIGRLLPESIARWVTRFWVFRAVDSVKLHITPKG